MKPLNSLQFTIFLNRLFADCVPALLIQMQVPDRCKFGPLRKGD